MKKLPLLIPALIFALGLSTFLSPALLAQSVPQGMKYQAVARDLSGKVLANQEINLKITLYSEIDRKKVEYSEQHSLKSNEVGLFDLVIGEGESLDGTFDEVPWDTKDIWMEVAIRDSDAAEYITINNSRMLSVPYAFHAGTANAISGEGEMTHGPGGVPSNVWSLFGNTEVDDTVDRLGTVNCADLVIITNDLERLRITCEGEVNIAGSINVGDNLDVVNNVHIGNDLTVDNNVTLNVNGGETIIKGNLTVDDMSSTHLTGTLTVDKATDLNSTLNVDGTTTLNDDLTVTGMSPTLLTGTLTVDKATQLNSTLDVSGDASFDQDVDITGDLTAASSKVSGPASLPLGGQSYVACFENTDAASAGTDGIAIKIGNIGGGQSNWHNNGDNDYITFFNGLGNATGSVEGFEILHDNPISTFPAPDFTDFFNIFDFSAAITLPSVDWSNLISFDPPSLSIDFGGLDFGFDPGGLSIDFANEFDPGGFDPGAFFNPGAAVGAAQSIADIVCWGIANGMESLITTNPFDLILAATVIAETNLCKENGGQGGVTYVSFGADYAEWLPRTNPNETMRNGQIVGVKNGRISKHTEGADQILAISTNPIVLGNKPPENREGLYEKVGFMGQVPVMAQGKVRVGDYIIPSGKNDGFGKAVHPDDLTIEHIPLILGRAWSNSENDYLSHINVAVGLNRNDIAKVAMKQEQELKALKDEVSSMRSSVDDQLAELAAKLKLIEHETVMQGSYSKQ